LKGSVSLNFLIDKDGNVDKVTILEENNPKLAQKAKQIIEQMPRFKPGQNALGVPVSVLYKVPIRFKN
jgi:TonB family protein